MRMKERGRNDRLVFYIVIIFLLSFNLVWFFDRLDFFFSSSNM